MVERCIRKISSRKDKESSAQKTPGKVGKKSVHGAVYRNLKAQNVNWKESFGWMEGKGLTLNRPGFLESSTAGGGGGADSAPPV